MAGRCAGVRPVDKCSPGLHGCLFMPATLDWVPPDTDRLNPKLPSLYSQTTDRSGACRGQKALETLAGTKRSSHTRLSHNSSTAMFVGPEVWRTTSLKSEPSLGPTRP